MVGLRYAYPTLRHYGADARSLNTGIHAMHVKHITPILNVSDLVQSFAWFETLGWKKGWEWGSPPSFGGVNNGHFEIFLSLDGQGGRGRSDYDATFGPESDEATEKGVWMSIWVDDADAVHRECIEHGIEVTWPPTDMPWNVREMHVRHPDGHVFRISQRIESRPDTSSGA
jgi:catechol 2,3-dioxygenase-like lactoylglutathione lyase family enzyme